MAFGKEKFFQNRSLVERFEKSLSFVGIENVIFNGLHSNP